MEAQTHRCCHIAGVVGESVKSVFPGTENPIPVEVRRGNDLTEFSLAKFTGKLCERQPLDGPIWQSTNCWFGCNYVVQQLLPRHRLGVQSFAHLQRRALLFHSAAIKNCFLLLLLPWCVARLTVSVPLNINAVSAQ